MTITETGHNLQENRFVVTPTMQNLQAILEMWRQEPEKFPSLAKLTEDFQRSPLFQDALPETYAMRSTLAEYIVNNIFQAAAVAFPDNIVVNPIHKDYPNIYSPKPTQILTPSKEYYVQVDRRTHNIIMKRAITTENQTRIVAVSEYDGLFIIDDTPVIVEVKALPTREEMQWSINHDVGQKLRKALGPATLERKINPIKDYFKTDQVGYWVFVTKGIASHDSSVQNEFRRNGGIITELPFTYTELNEAARRILQETQ